MYISISGDVPRFYILRRHFGMLHFLSVFTSFLFRLILNTTEMILIFLHNDIKKVNMNMEVLLVKYG